MATAGVLDGFTSDPFGGTVLVRGHGPADRGAATVIVLPAPFTGRPLVTGASFNVRTVNGIRQVLLYARGGPWQLRIG
jgi:hypothetical protein